MRKEMKEEMITFLIFCIMYGLYFNLEHSVSTQDENVKVTYLGVADDEMIKEHEQQVDKWDYPENIILASFNAG
jgi:hypothetical protein